MIGLLDICEAIVRNSLKVNLVGSRFSVSPAVTGTDVDLLVLVPDLCKAGEALLEDGWVVHTSADSPDYECGDEAPFITARKGITNYIIYEDPFAYGLFLGAMRVCKLRNWKDKADRVLAVRAATESKFFEENPVAF